MVSSNKAIEIAQGYVKGYWCTWKFRAALDLCLGLEFRV